MNKPELISAYCLSYQNWTVIPHQIEEDFKEMRDMGFNAVDLSFSESEFQYARRTFDLQIRIAKAAGLKVNVIPSRWGGRFAGAPLMPSIWLSRNPQDALLGYFTVACIESPAFRDWFRERLETLLTDYDVDGIIWDEPKDIDFISRHPETIKKFGENPTRENMMDSFAEFLGEMSEFCFELRPGIKQTLFVQNSDSEYFTRKASQIKTIHYHGYDGNLSRQSFFREEPQWHKNRIDDVWTRTLAECGATGKKSFALVENMLMPSAAMAEFDENFKKYLSGPLPDHLAIYYYAHNNEDPEAVHEIVKRHMSKLLGKRKP